MLRNVGVGVGSGRRREEVALGIECTAILACRWPGHASRNPCRIVHVRIALGQINPTIGDFEGNLASIEEALSEAERRDADLLVLPELALCGYPPHDLLERPAFLAAG